MKNVVLLFWLLLPALSDAQCSTGRHRMEKEDTLSLFFIGDIMQHGPQITGAWNEERQDYDYEACFRYIRPYWEQANYVIGNLETTLSNRNFSGYPQFCAPWQLARDLKACGVDFLTTNNNHSCDKGHSGIRKTIHYLDSLGIPHTGTFTDTASWITETPQYLQLNGFKIALLSYTYGTNGIPVTNGQVVSMIDTFHMARHIQKAQLDSATNIIVCMHWGIEYETSPNKEQRQLSAWLHRQGADIIIGSHPHVVQPVEYTIEQGDTTGLTVYSLGNFVSNQSKRYTNGGLCLSLQLRRHKERTHYKAEYLSHYVHRPIENEVRRYYVIPEPEKRHLAGHRDSLLWQEFFHDTDSIIGGAIPKYNNRQNTDIKTAISVN